MQNFVLSVPSLPNFKLFCRTREELLSIYWFSDFEYLDPYRRHWRSNFEVVRNGPKFCKFLAEIFLGKAPEFGDLDYKIEHTSDHVTKFRGDRLTELGDLASK